MKTFLCYFMREYIASVWNGLLYFSSGENLFWEKLHVKFSNIVYGPPEIINTGAVTASVKIAFTIKSSLTVYQSNRVNQQVW